MRVTYGFAREHSNAKRERLRVPAAAGGAPLRRAALVWCVDRGDDPVAGLSDAQRLAVLTHVLPARVGRLAAQPVTDAGRWRRDELYTR